MRSRIAVFGLLLSLLSEPGMATGPVTIRVPVAPPSLTIVEEGEPEPVWTEPAVEPHNEIQLTDATGHSFDHGGPPRDALAAINILRSALPPDYLEMLMQDFGYERTSQGNGSVRSGRTDLREYDLAHFLFDRWVFSAPDSRLAREFFCLSPGERSIGPFLTLLAYAEAHSGTGEIYRRRPVLDGYRLARGSVQNARTAWARCRDLVERGWTLPR